MTRPLSHVVLPAISLLMLAACGGGQHRTTAAPAPSTAEANSPWCAGSPASDSLRARFASDPVVYDHEHAIGAISDGPNLRGVFPVLEDDGLRVDAIAAVELDGTDGAELLVMVSDESENPTPFDIFAARGVTMLVFAECGPNGWTRYSPPFEIGRDDVTQIEGVATVSVGDSGPLLALRIMSATPTTMEWYQYATLLQLDRTGGDDAPLGVTSLGATANIGDQFIGPTGDYWTSIPLDVSGWYPLAGSEVPVYLAVRRNRGMVEDLDAEPIEDEYGDLAHPMVERSWVEVALVGALLPGEPPFIDFGPVEGAWVIAGRGALPALCESGTIRCERLGATDREAIAGAAWIPDWIAGTWPGLDATVEALAAMPGADARILANDPNLDVWHPEEDRPLRPEEIHPALRFRIELPIAGAR